MGIIQAHESFHGASLSDKLKNVCRMNALVKRFIQYSYVFEKLSYTVCQEKNIKLKIKYEHLALPAAC